MHRIENYSEPSLYGHLPPLQRALVTARIDAQKEKLYRLTHKRLRALLIENGLAESDAEARSWTKPEMAFELAALIVELDGAS